MEQQPTGLEYFQSEWGIRFTDLCRQAGLSSLQEAAYRHHLRGLTPFQMAEAEHGSFGAPGSTVSTRKRYWRKVHRYVPRYTAALEQAKNLLAQVDGWREAGARFRSQLVECLGNREGTWARTNEFPTTGGETVYAVAPKVVTRDDVRYQPADAALRLFVQDLARDVESPVFAG